MKSLTEISKLIEAEQLRYNSLPNKPAAGMFDEPVKDISKRDLNLYLDQMAFLRDAQKQLQLNHSEKQLSDEVFNLRIKISELSKRSVPVTFYPPNFKGNHSDYFNKHMGINDLKAQLKIIEFILL